MKVLTVSEEDVGCSVPGILRVPEVINQSFNRLRRQKRECDMQHAGEIELERRDSAL